jgi:DNA-binding response OmpR family regulator
MTICRNRSSSRFWWRGSTRCSRRHGWQNARGTSLGAADVFTFAGRTVDFDAQELRVGDDTHHLTLMETNLLRYLVQREGQAVSRKNMLEDVWNLREDTDTRAIDHFIARLRKYIEDEPARPKHLLTVRGVGYKFVTDSAPKRPR